MEISVLRLGELGPNCYIFRQEDSPKCGVVDPGDHGEQLAKWLKDKGLEPEAVLLTHRHFDHIMGIPGLRAAWHELPIYCHPADLGTGDTVTMFGQSYPTVRSFGNVTPWKEGDRITVAGVELEVLETTGDTLFAGSMGRTDFEGGDGQAMMASLRRLGELEGDYQVLPGHEGQTTLEVERQTNYCLRAAMGR